MIILNARQEPIFKPMPPNPEPNVFEAKRLKWMRECFDPITGKPNENYFSFDEWIRMDKPITK